MTQPLRIIKKYPNRRLYDTEKSVYITLADVHDLLREGVDFKVVDVNTGEDITRTILIQIITEQEAGDSPIFTTETLTRFIRFYGDATQAMFGDFLGKSLEMFAEQQKRLKEQMGGIGGGASPFGTPLNAMQDLARRNIDIWQDMQKRFFSFGAAAAQEPPPPPAESKKSVKNRPRRKKTGKR